jgi:hypothetical protein
LLEWRGLYGPVYTVARYRCNREIENPSRGWGFYYSK